MINSSVILTNVDKSGKVYKGTIRLLDLFQALKKPIIHYCPATQRGQFNPDNPDEMTSSDYDALYQISYKHLALDENKVHEIAVLYLMGDFYWTDIIWNARIDPDFPPLEYDEKNRSLKIFSTITIPDSAHRHKAYYTLFEWQKNNDLIPCKVTFTQTMTTVIKEDIIKFLDEKFNPNEVIFVNVHNITAEQEGELFRQMNLLTKKANTAQVIRVNPDLSPSTRFVRKLMENSSIFSDSEIETNRTSIHKNSRKLVPNSTLVTAIKPFSNELSIYEKNERVYLDLVEFVGDFYLRLSEHYPELKPSASAEKRHDSRKESYIISNIIFIPLFKIAFELWKSYHGASKTWRSDISYLKVIDNLNKTIKIKDTNGNDFNVNIMSKKNMQWIGIIANERAQITNNRISQRSAYLYLAKECSLEEIKKEISPLKLKL